MDNNHQKFDSQSIANRVRELFVHYGIGKRQHAKELSRILDLSFSHAHRKLKGQSPWTLEQINNVAAALGETPAAIVDTGTENDISAQTMVRDAIFYVGGVELACVAYIGHELVGGRSSEYVALQQAG
ncbi:helix-turn-helix domain-containing protein [Serratia quinivorans]|uniref:helix-turn-helix domain-containing protein n=2 Tax=Serratia TaxID=613 RepID=UPI0021793838|nr:helix-turn-helix domain-containing protein [Serratia quinivorans]CAI1185132.1 BetR domain [Serratia quinivorans]